MRPERPTRRRTWLRTRGGNVQNTHNSGSAGERKGSLVLRSRRKSRVLEQIVNGLRADQCQWILRKVSYLVVVRTACGCGRRRQTEGCTLRTPTNRTRIKHMALLASGDQE